MEVIYSEGKHPLFQKRNSAVLVDRQIKELCEKHKLLEPFDPSLLNPNSIDVRIGDTMQIETKEGFIDYDLSVHSKDAPYWLAPNEFVLVATQETFNIPEFVCGEFKIKSSRAREGYTNALAVFLDSGWFGSKLTLEIKNYRNYAKLPLYPGLKIGQIVLYYCDVPDASYKVTGRYNGHTTVHGSLG